MRLGRLRLLPEALVSAPVFWLTLVWVALVQVGELSAAGGSADHFGLRLAVFASVQLVMFAFPYITWRLICPRVRPQSWNRLLLISLIVGAVVRGVILSLALRFLGLTESLDLGFRIVASLTHMAVIVFILWFLVSEVRELQTRRRLLIAERDQLLALQRVAQRDLRNLSDRATEEIRRSLLESLGDVRSADSTGLRERLRVTIDDVVRPLSQQLATQPSAWMPPEPPAETAGIDWSLAVREGLDPRRIHPVIVPVLLIWIGLPIYLFRYGPAPTAGFIATLLVAIPAFWLARKAAVRMTIAQDDGAKISGFVIAVIVGGAALGLATLPYMRFEPQPFVFVFIAPLLALLLSGPLAIGEAARDQDLELESALEAATADLRWALARAREQHRQQEGALAHALHGRLQASLAAAFLRLDLAVAQGVDDQSLLDGLRTEVLKAVDDLNVVTSDPEPIDGVLEKTQSTWSGTAHLMYSLDPQVIAALALDPLCGRSVNDLIPELVFNSIRHGGATWIEVRIENEGPRTLRLSVIDNGGRDLVTTRIGLGSALLNDAAVSWTRTRDGNTTTTSCLLPLMRPDKALATR